MDFPTIDMSATGQHIKMIMTSQGLNVKEVQDHLSLGAPQSVYKWLRGEALPSVDNLYALSKLLEIPLDCLLVGKKNSAVCYSSKHEDARRKKAVPSVNHYFVSTRA